MATTDICAHLADALAETWTAHIVSRRFDPVKRRNESWLGCTCGWEDTRNLPWSIADTRRAEAAHFATVLLSLPGIAIVETAAPAARRRAGLRRRSNHGKHGNVRSDVEHDEHHWDAAEAEENRRQW